MNKISKKIVAIVTMAMFIITMMPFAAFAAYGSTVDVNKDYREVSLGANGSVEVKVDAQLVQEDSATANTNGAFLWLEDKDHNVYPYVVKGENLDSTAIRGVLALQATDTNSRTFSFSVKNPGEYTVHLGIGNKAKAQVTTFEDIDQVAVAEHTVTVDAADAYINSLQITKPTPEDTPAQDADSGSIKFNAGNTPNGIDATSVEAEVAGVLSSDDETVADITGQEVTVDNGNNASKGLYVFEKGTENEIETVTVDKARNIEFDIKAMSGTKAGIYHIYLSAGEVDYDLSVIVGDSAVDSIEVVDNSNNVVSTKDFDFDGVVEFVFKDAAGNEVDAPSLKYQVVSGPDKHGLVAGDFSVEKNADQDAYKLKINKTTLKAGDYTVRVAIPNGKSVEASFTVAKAGDAVDYSIEMESGVDTIVLGDTAKGTVYAIDENGIKTKAKDVTLGYNGAAVANDASTSISSGEFTVKAKDREDLLGSKITVTVLDKKAGIIATKELTVVDGLSNYTLEFDSTNGAAAKDNTVNVSVVDENGNVKNVSGTAYAYVESTTDETAKVTVSDQVTVKNGKAKLTVYSNIETGADIVVAVKETNGSAIYANTLSYTFGEEDVNADTIVAMTIGSADYIVNNDIVKGDAAPYVDGNWRTMVPVRALTEAFGAKVTWDGDARTITIVDGSTTIVMTADKTTYTVNGVEKEMDTTPVIGTDARTYVPVRFVADALGYKVTPTKDANGLTAGVVFQK